MAAPSARGRADYDYLIKLLLIGDSAYYRGAMGILLVYDVTDESSFNNIRNWIRNIEQHASDNVNKILVGNKADMELYVDAWNYGIRHVQVESDSWEAIRCIEESANSRTTNALVVVIRELLQRTWELSFKKVGRKANRVVDWLAKDMREKEVGRNFFATPNPKVVVLLMSDLQ
ncbi:hypothetical protein GQ457_02G038970 [Hibiscus cannabinus]